MGFEIAKEYFITDTPRQSFQLRSVQHVSKTTFSVSTKSKLHLILEKLSKNFPTILKKITVLLIIISPNHLNSLINH